MSKTLSLTSGITIKALLLVALLETTICIAFSIIVLVKIIAIPPIPPIIGNPQQQQLDQALTLLEGVVRAN